MQNVYDELVEALDKISFGFPKTFIGVEKALVKKFFTPKDARHFVDMLDGYQTPAMYATKIGVTENEALEILEDMARRGLVYRKRLAEGPQYRKYPFCLGFIEFQVQNPDTTWKTPTGMYMALSSFGKRMSASMPFYRAVPMHKEFVEGSQILPYDDIEAVLDRHTKFAVTTCLCRIMFQMKPGNKCHHPLETCISTDDLADFYLENGWGRQITKEETLALLREGEKDGRVIHITNSQDGENICSCCACGCGMLYLKEKYRGPSRDYWSNYYCEVDEEKCTSCGACTKRCHFGVLSIKQGKLQLERDYCLGCGLCLSSCPRKALKLLRKPEDKLYVPPETYDDAIEIWQAKRKEG